MHPDPAARSRASRCRRRSRRSATAQPGAGQYLLPVENTVTPVDADLINNIQRSPFRERLSILLNELGTGLAARAEDLQELRSGAATRR